MLAITKYADRLIKDLDTVDYIPAVKTQQINWIGRSQGVNFKNKVKDMDIEFEVYDSIPQTHMAQTFIVIAPEHPLVKKLIEGTEHEQPVLKFVDKIIKKKQRKKFDLEKAKDGIFTGRYSENWMGTGRDLPIWVASFAVMDYGTGIVNCSVHDKRDFAFAKEHDMMVLHDFAYAEICFDGYRPQSILEVPGARDVAIEFVSLSKSHSMAGWRVGFACGNREMIHALTRIKSYLDYGMPQAIQIGAITALRGPQDCVDANVEEYKSRRDALIDGLGAPGEGQWKIEKPLATMFVWAQVPEPFRELGSLEFSKRLLKEAGVAVSAGIGFGETGEGHVRFALIENNHRIRQAVRGIRRFLRQARDGG